MFGRRGNNGDGLVIVWLLFSLLHASPSSTFGSSEHIIDSKAPPGNATVQPEAAYGPLDNVTDAIGGISIKASARVKRADCANMLTPFACVARQILEARKLPHKLGAITCEPCDMKKCDWSDTYPLKLYGKGDETFRMETRCDPEPLVCKDAADEKCIQPVRVGQGNEESWMLFPHNLCTRDMVKNGECPTDQISTTQYNYLDQPYSTAYYVQCDESWIVPTIAGASGCVASLHVAAGLAPNDPEVFPGEVKDLDYDRTKDKLCPKNAPATDNCILRPLLNFPLEPGLAKAGFKDEVVTPCSYKQRGVKVEKDCVLLDLIVDGKVMEVDRRGHGPYATLQSPNDSLTMTWKADSTYPYSFPRCININDIVGLPIVHVTTVSGDTFMRCDENPYYARAKEQKITIGSVDPFDCNTEKELRRLLCRWTATEANSTETPAALASNRLFDYDTYLGWWTIGGCLILGVAMPLLTICIFAIMLRKIELTHPDTRARWFELKPKTISECKNFAERVHKLGIPALLDEYTPAGMIPETDCKASTKNAAKNRYQNYPAPDKTRFQLDQDPDRYFNAVVFRMKHSDVEWVLTQAPIPGTCEDFWTMMKALYDRYELKIMLMALNAFDPVIEGDNYLPHDESRVAARTKNDLPFCTFGEWCPTAQTIDGYEGVSRIPIANLPAAGHAQLVEGMRSRDLENYINVVAIKKDDLAGDLGMRNERRAPEYLGEREVKNLLYCRALLRMMWKDPWGRNHLQVVQCASGVGVSAVYVMVHVSIERLLYGWPVSIPELLKEIREHSPLAICNKEHYITVYACVLLFIQAYLPDTCPHEVSHALSQIFEYNKLYP